MQVTSQPPNKGLIENPVSRRINPILMLHTFIEKAPSDCHENKKLWKSKITK